MALKQIVIIGAGGFAREMQWLIRDINAAREQYRFVGYIVSDLGRLGPRDSRNNVLGDLRWLEANRASIDAVAIGIGTPTGRLKAWREISAIHPNAEVPPLIHPGTVIDSDTTTIEAGAQVCAGSIVSVNVRLSPLSLCSFQCTIAHEAVIGEASVVYPGTNVSGGVVIGKGVVVGTGARIVQYCKVGDHATVAAGAVVVCDVDSGTTVFGSPARPSAPASLAATAVAGSLGKAPDTILRS